MAKRAAVAGSTRAAEKVSLGQSCGFSPGIQTSFPFLAGVPATIQSFAHPIPGTQRSSANRVDQNLLNSRELEQYTDALGPKRLFSSEEPVCVLGFESELTDPYLAEIFSIHADTSDD
jgi:hypothetical protein